MITMNPLEGGQWVTMRGQWVTVNITLTRPVIRNKYDNPYHLCVLCSLHLLFLG